VSELRKKNGWTDRSDLYMSFDVFLRMELPFGDRDDCVCVNIFSGVYFFSVAVSCLTRYRPNQRVGSRPSDHYFRSVCLFVCLYLSVCLFVYAEFFSAVFDPISIKLGHMLYVWI